MKITAAEIALIVRGEATPELEARFAQQAEDPQGDLRKLLEGVAIWARTKLSPPATFSPPAAEETPAEPYQVLKQAAYWGIEGTAESKPSDLENLVACVRGTASPEIIAAVKQSLDDPTSTLSKLVQGLKQYRP